MLLTLVVYKFILVGIGLWASSRNRNETDFFLGGRQLGPFVAGLSYAASTSSAWVILGFSGFVYAVGLSATWMIPGILAGYAVVWLYFGKRLQQESRSYNQVTLTDFLLQDARGPFKRITAAIAALLVLLCFVFYIAAQFDAAGKALTEHFALSAVQAVMLGAAIVLIYSLLGGFWAVSATDTLQAVVMMLVSLGVPVATLVAAGGPIEVWRELGATMPAAFLQINGGYSGLLLLGFIVGTVGMSLGALGQPHLLNRLMAIRSAAERHLGFYIVLSWGIVVYVGMVMLGLSGRALLPTLDNGEVLFYQAASQYLPAIAAGLVIAATLSAVMSTVDSILLAAAGAVAQDMGVNARFAQHKLMASRWVMFAIALLAVLLTLSLPDSIFNRVLFAWSALGAAFGPIVVCRVMRRTVGAGVALACMLSGFATTVLFYSMGALPATDSMLSQAAYLPGDPFERAVPWLLPLLILAKFARRDIPQKPSCVVG